MSGLLVLVGIVWIVYKLVSEACTPQVPSGTDWNKAINDIGKISSKEYNKRLTSGYYVKRK